jgi:REP element-mobilizing transposase RayT
LIKHALTENLGFVEDRESQTGFPRRLHHGVPGWVKAGSCFHIRLRVAPENRSNLCDQDFSQPLIEAVAQYHLRQRWFCRLFVLMPDHAHAMLSFANNIRMAGVVSDWKRFTSRQFGIRWQSNFFDHRIRNEAEEDKTYTYIRENPVVKKFCQSPDDWPWIWEPNC